MSLCIFGDSITWGACDARHGGWATRIRLHFESIGSEVEVYNLGISGNTTRDLLQRFSDEATARGATAIIFAFGINDTIAESIIPAERFAQNFQMLLDMAADITPNVGCVGITCVDAEHLKKADMESYGYNNTSIGAYDALIKKLCEAKEIPYVHVFNTITPSDLPDGLHPNSHGHEKLFHKILPMAEALFE